MKWSLKLGKILGIDVYIHVTFLLLLGFVGLGSWLAERTAQAAIGGVLFFVALFGCVLLHEYGHALAARGYGIHTRDITLLPIGGLARLERMPDRPVQELWVALAGPAVNVVIAAALAVGLLLSGSWEPISSLSTVKGNFVERLLMVNIFLVAFNMLPAFPMDGGRVLRSLLAMRMDYARATNIAATIGQGMALLFGFAGLFTNPMLLFIAFFVWIGASQEAAAAEMKSSLSGALVRDAMLTDVRSLTPTQTAGDAARFLLAGCQQDFPVVDNGRLLGILLRTDLFEALRGRGESVSVGEIMRHNFETADPEQPLELAMSQVKAEERASSIPVLRNGILAGLLTAENIGEFFMIKTALAQHPKRRPPVLQPPPLPPPFRTAPHGTR